MKKKLIIVGIWIIIIFGIFIVSSLGSNEKVSDEIYDKLKKSHPGWNDVLHRASKVPGSNVKPV